MDGELYLDWVVNVVGVNGNLNRGRAGLDVKCLDLPAHKQLRFVRERLCMAKDG
jgi:hypothetical protein